MGKIYFVRHGQTDRNLIKQMNPGDVDSELNKKGLEQAVEAGKKAKKDGLEFDIIISSPLQRALNTAKIIAKEIGYKGEILEDERLKEQFAGVLKDYTHEELKKEFNFTETEEIRKIYKSSKYNKKEDIIDLYNRVTEAYDEIKGKYSGKKVLLVGHNGTYRILSIHSKKIDFYTANYAMDSAPNSVIIEL